MVKPSHLCDGFRGEALRDVRPCEWSPHERGSCPIERDPREYPCLFIIGVHSSKMAFDEGRTQTSSDTESARMLLLDFSVSRTVKNKFRCLETTKSMEFSYGSPSTLRHIFLQGI